MPTGRWVAKPVLPKQRIVADPGRWHSHTQAPALLSPAVEGILTEQDVVPFAAAPVLGGQPIDPVAPGNGGPALAEHVRAGELSLCLGLDQIDELTGTGEKFGE